MGSGGKGRSDYLDPPLGENSEFKNCKYVVRFEKKPVVIFAKNLKIHRANLTVHAMRFSILICRIGDANAQLNGIFHCIGGGDG